MLYLNTLCRPWMCCLRTKRGIMEHAWQRSWRTLVDWFDRSFAPVYHFWTLTGKEMPIMAGSLRTLVDWFDRSFGPHIFVHGRELFDDVRAQSENSQSKCCSFQEHIAVQNASLLKAVQERDAYHGRKLEDFGWLIWPQFRSGLSFLNVDKERDAYHGRKLEDFGWLIWLQFWSTHFCSRKRAFWWCESTVRK